MTQHISEVEIKELEDLYAKATPGTWGWDDPMEYGTVFIDTTIKDKGLTVDSKIVADIGPRERGKRNTEHGSAEQLRNDAKFISTAHNRIPRLIAALRAEQAKNARMMPIIKDLAVYGVGGLLPVEHVFTASDIVRDEWK